MTATPIILKALVHPRLPLMVTALAVLLMLPALWVGWQTDDYMHKLAMQRPAEFRDVVPPPLLMFSFVPGDAAQTHRLMDIGWLPWWTYDGLRLAFCRVVTALTHWVDYQLWPRSPALMHAHSLLWLALLVYGAALVYRRVALVEQHAADVTPFTSGPARHGSAEHGAALAPAALAGLAAVLYAVDHTHAMPAAWLANRNGIVAAALGAWALVAHVRWRADGWRWGVLLAPALLLGALLAGELAVGAGAYIVAYAVCIERGPWRRRIAGLGPSVFIGLGWWLTYRALGFGAYGSAWYVDPGRDPLGFTAAVVERAPILLLGQWAGPPPEFYLMFAPSAQRVHWLAALAFILVLGVAFVPLLRRDRFARFWALGMLLALLPVCATVPFDRLLLLAGVGALGLLARYLLWVWQARRAVGWFPAIVAVALAGLHLVVSPLAVPLRAWSTARLGGLIESSVATPADDPALRDQHVVLVNGPGAMVGSFYFQVLRLLHGQSTPAHTRILASGIDDVTVTRVDERTLLVRPATGFAPPPGTVAPGAEHPWFNLGYMLQNLDRLVRDDRHPFVVGQRIELTGLGIEVTAVTADGRAAEARFRFAVPLEDPSLRWMQWGERNFVPFTPPAVGTTVTLPGPKVKV